MFFSFGLISFPTKKKEENHWHEVQLVLESPKYPTLLLLCPESDVLTTKVKKTKNALRKREYSGQNFGPNCQSGQSWGSRVSGCVSSCLLFPDWLSGEHAGPEEVMAAPPSRDNIAFLPEFFRTFQLDFHALAALWNYMILCDCLFVWLSACAVDFSN